MSRTKKYWNTKFYKDCVRRREGFNPELDTTVAEKFKWKEDIDSSIPWNSKRPCDEWTKSGDTKQIYHQIERAWEKEIALNELKEYYEELFD